MSNKMLDNMLVVSCLNGIFSFVFKLANEPTAAKICVAGAIITAIFGMVNYKILKRANDEISSIEQTRNK